MLTTSTLLREYGMYLLETDGLDATPFSVCLLPEKREEREVATRKRDVATHSSCSGLQFGAGAISGLRQSKVQSREIIELRTLSLS
jgi:hypothetical protein